MYTQEDVIELKKAIATGALSVKIADRSIAYRSTEEMIRILSMIENEIAGNANANSIKTYYVSHNKGL